MGIFKNKKLFLFLFITVIFLGDISGSEKKKLSIITTILPFKEFIKSVGGNRVDVTSLIPPGANPHTYELTPGQLKDVSRAAMYVKVGSGIEFELVWLDKILTFNRNLMMCNASEGIALVEGDPHVWLSLRNTKIIVKNIKNALILLDPVHKASYVDNAEKYVHTLDNYDRKFSKELAPFKTKKILVFHPSWGYFVRDYNLGQIPVEIEGKEPSPKRIRYVIDAARQHTIKTIFIAPQQNPKTASIIAREINGVVAFADPLAEQFLENLQEIVDEIVKSYE